MINQAIAGSVDARGSIGWRLPSMLATIDVLDFDITIRKLSTAQHHQETLTILMQAGLTLLVDKASFQQRFAKHTILKDARCIRRT